MDIRCFLYSFSPRDWDLNKEALQKKSKARAGPEASALDRGAGSGRHGEVGPFAGEKSGRVGR